MQHLAKSQSKQGGGMPELSSATLKHVKVYQITGEICELRPPDGGSGIVCRPRRSLLSTQLDTMHAGCCAVLQWCLLSFILTLRFTCMLLPSNSTCFLRPLDWNPGWWWWLWEETWENALPLHYVRPFSRAASKRRRRSWSDPARLTQMISI